MVSQWTHGHSTCKAHAKGEHAGTQTLTHLFWTLLDTTGHYYAGPAQLLRRVALAAAGQSPRATAPRDREPWSSVRGERLSARIIHCHHRVRARQPGRPPAPADVGQRPVEPREAPVDDAGHLHLREQEVILRGAAHARMSHSTGS